MARGGGEWACSSDKRRARSSAPRAGSWSASTTRSASTAGASAPACGDSRARCACWPAATRSCLFVMWACGAIYLATLAADPSGIVLQRTGHPLAEHRQRAPFRGRRRRAGLRAEPLVDAALRRLAPRRPGPHRLQPAFDPEPRPARRPFLRRLADHPHLRDQQRLRVRGQQRGPVRVPRVFLAARRGPDDAGCVGRGVRPDRRRSPLRPPRRQLADPQPGGAVDRLRHALRLHGGRRSTTGPTWAGWPAATWLRSGSTR